jgi:hypothetical protein
MQFLINVLFAEPGYRANAEEAAAVDVFNDKLVADGHWIFAGGLSPQSEATVFDNREGAGLVTNGPFVESKEFVAGFWVINAPDLDTARRLAADGSKACNRRTELRPLLKV